MKLITHKELKAKLDRGDDFKLVMVLGEYAFNAKHIPGSVNIPTPQPDSEHLNLDEEIVVYCSDSGCHASVDAFYCLEAGGYTKVRRYAGGVQDWEEAGYPLEGEMVE
jgi:rhodanese-related sulfurtransferase